MDNVLDSNFSKAFAIAWNEKQGGYSETIAKKTINFAKNQGLKISTVLDICCGSGNFLHEMQLNGKRCTGTEILDSYIDYNKQKFPEMKFIKTESMLDFEGLETYDLISCNHDVVNMLPTLEDWGSFFKQVYAHLNNGGIFIFDYYTKRRLQGWNEVTYDENEKLDYIKNIFSDGQTKTTISNVYYINLNPKKENENLDEKVYSLNNHDNKYKKTEDSMVEYFFENEDILNEIKKAGYRYLITTDANFAPVAGINDMNRVHIIAIKREAVAQKPTAPSETQPAQPTPTQMAAPQTATPQPVAETQAEVQPQQVAPEQSAVPEIESVSKSQAQVSETPEISVDVDPVRFTEDSDSTNIE